MTIRRIAKIGLQATALGVAAVGLMGQVPQGLPTAIMPVFTPSSQNNQTPGEPPISYPSEPSVTVSPFRYGPFVLQPDLSYQLSYETGLQAAPGRATDVTVQTLSAEMIVQEGTVWNLSYTPKWVRYSSSLFEDTVDQDARLGANFPYQDWELQVAQSYDRSSDPLIETGRQTREQTYGTDAKALYGGSYSQPSVEVTFHQDVRFATLSPAIYDWTNQDWIHLPVSQQWDFAVGPGGGYTHEDPGFDMVYARPEFRVIWRPAQKLSLDAQGGIQDSKFLTSSRDRFATPIFNASLIYRPWPTTTATAAAIRAVAASLLADQLSESTTINVSLEQRLLVHYYLTVQANGGKTDYLSAGSALANVRGDNTNSLQVSLSTVFFRRLNIGLSAARVHNSSNVEGFGLSSNQFGFQAALKY